MQLSTTGLALPINKALINILESELNKLPKEPDHTIILNFRDMDYGPETGGYHPVEIMLNPNGAIQYITDFAYVGYGDMAELAKEIDFDFTTGILEHMGRVYPIEEAWELFQIWQQNFCAYYAQGIYDVSIRFG